MTDVTYASQEIPDFGNGGKVTPPIPFLIDGETFYAVGNQPAGVLFDLAAMQDAKGLEGQVRIFSTFIQALLLPESFERLKGKMRDPVSPFTFPQMMKLIEWLMEKYSGRPTQQSSSSSQPSGVASITSTVGAPPAA